MRRAVVKEPIPAPPVKNKRGRPKKVRELAPAKVCEREGCTNIIAPSKKKYCSAVCRNIGINANGNPGGLATDKYKPEYATTTLKEYLEWCEMKHEPTLIPTESSYIVIHNAKMPTLEDYAIFIGVHPATPKNWAERHIEFARAMDVLTAIQRTFLLNNGLSGRYNSTIAKLALSANHGMVERHEVDNTHKFIGVVKHLYGRADEIEKQIYGGK